MMLNTLSWHCRRNCQNFLACNFVPTIRKLHGNAGSGRKRPKSGNRPRRPNEEMIALKREELVSKFIDSVRFENKQNDILCVYGISHLNNRILTTLIQDEDTFDLIEKLYIVDNDEEKLSKFHEKHCKDSNKIKCVIGDAFSMRIPHCHTVLSQLPNSCNIDFIFKLVRHFYESNPNLLLNLDSDVLEANEGVLTETQRNEIVGPRNMYIVCNRELCQNLKIKAGNRDYSRLAVSTQLLCDFKQAAGYRSERSVTKKKYSIMKMDIGKSVYKLENIWNNDWIWNENNKYHLEWISFLKLCFGKNSNKLLLNVFRDSHRSGKIKIDNFDSLEALMTKLEIRNDTAKTVQPDHFLQLFRHVMRV